MTNLTIENYIKNNMDSTEVEHLADYGLDHVAPNGLISYHERTEFFDKYYNDIQAEMIDLAEGVWGIAVYGDPFNSYAFIETLRDNAVSGSNFDTIDDKESQLYLQGLKQIKADYPDWESMDKDELQDLAMDYMADVEPEPSKNDKSEWVALVFEIVAQRLINEQ